MTTDEDGSITHWLQLLRGGDQEAAARLWDRYVHRLHALLRTRICGAAYDEQDVALSAFHVLCRGMAEGRYPQLSNRDELWQLLATIAVRKSRDRREAEMCAKRSGGNVLSADIAQLDKLASTLEDPEFEALMADECRRLLDLLQNPRLEQVVLWKLDGYTHDEIADKLGLTRWSVGRMLQCVRRVWETQL
ncbi:MAG: ECF-type sigma factor [Pirellulaceae bacterium]|jgi:DNA-directed RNA polymerase specialized sigma24 family protein|nr:ECF-type sigma factor [Pirellulaceae bacterium]